MAASLAVTLASGADSALVARRFQTVIDGCVAPRLDVVALVSGGSVSASFPDNVPSEQVLACYEGMVNRAGLPSSGMVSGSVALSGGVSSGSRSRVYSV